MDFMNSSREKLGKFQNNLAQPENVPQNTQKSRKETTQVFNNDQAQPVEKHNSLALETMEQNRTEPAKNSQSIQASSTQETHNNNRPSSTQETHNNNNNNKPSSAPPSIAKQTRKKFNESSAPTFTNKHTTATSINHNRPVNQVVPKVWVIANFAVPVSQQIAVEALKKGDTVVLGYAPGGSLEASTLKKAESLKSQAPDRCLQVELNVSSTSRAYVGALEEVEEWHFRHQMDITFYGTVNMIQAVLPCMRKQFCGHIINICDINGNIGTPALSLLAASMHAVEGYSEALAFEIAPFNIKVSMVEAPMEVNLFTVPIVFAAALPQYGPTTMVGKVRDMLGKANVFPKEAFDQTVHTVISIAGLENPPGRIIVGKEAIRQVKDKLAMLSDDLEEFQSVGEAADFEKYYI